MRFAIRFATLSTIWHECSSALYGTDTRLTIPTPTQNSGGGDPQTLALNALGWIVIDDDRAGHFLALTGLTPDELRASLGYPSTLAAVLEYLCGHEPDLIAAAEALGCRPQDLVAARERLTA
ncbi:DUF3572 domain-containing protein [uncultured Novosphingobium sp.]|uniref:DUF3572 domain-containing protein n=1 Tax=uncultured Novosphingobium sp. TaxID=292277 RepID=UPI00338FAF0E